MERSAVDVAPTPVTVQGRLDALEAANLRQTLADLVADGQTRIAVDLSEADFVDSAGLAALVKYMKETRLLGGDLRLVRPRSQDAFRVFSLTKFDEIFVIADELDELLRDW